MPWGPWINCDGAGMPDCVTIPARVEMRVEVNAGRHPAPGQNIVDWPGFWWRWRRVRDGLFSTRRARVCDDPAFAPVVAIRVWRPDALDQLLALVANPPPLIAKDRVMPDPTLHGNGQDCPACALQREAQDTAAVLRPAVACNLCGGAGRIAIPTADIIAHHCADAREHWTAFDARNPRTPCKTC